MRKPDFFIIGGPKCGTTALFQYLSKHQRIFMPDIKETKYFSSDIEGFRSRHIQTESQYMNLFREASDEHIAVGEASVFYMYSSVAVPAILKFQPEARFIAMVRNPVDLVYSLHHQLLFGGYECISDKDFGNEWKHQRGITEKEMKESGGVLYRNVGRLGEQVQRLYSLVPQEQTMIIVFDDFAADTPGTYRDVLKFLGVPNDGRTEFPAVNVNKVRRYAWPDRIYRRIPSWITKCAYRLGLKHSMYQALKRKINCIRQKRDPLPGSLRAEMVEEFSDDIDLLASLLHRDLKHWKHTDDIT